MLILALDTTTRGGSCALARDGVVLREEGSSAEHPPAARLPADLMMLLTHAGVTLADVDVFAVATGPGSFTGLRIGIATMQGLGFAAGKPLIGISGFDALAATVTHAPTSIGLASDAATATIPWVDAWRGEVYAATYVAGRQVAAPIVSPPADLLRQITGTATFVGDGAVTYRELIGDTLGERARFAALMTPRLAGTIARLAFAAAQRGELPPPDAIKPLYVRRPDAELARDRA